MTDYSSKQRLLTSAHTTVSRAGFEQSLLDSFSNGSDGIETAGESISREFILEQDSSSDLLVSVSSTWRNWGNIRCSFLRRPLWSSALQHWARFNNSTKPRKVHVDVKLCVGIDTLAVIEIRNYFTLHVIGSSQSRILLSGGWSGNSCREHACIHGTSTVLVTDLYSWTGETTGNVRIRNCTRGPSEDPCHCYSARLNTYYLKYTVHLLVQASHRACDSKWSLYFGTELMRSAGLQIQTHLYCRSWDTLWNAGLIRSCNTVKICILHKETVHKIQSSCNM